VLMSAVACVTVASQALLGSLGTLRPAVAGAQVRTSRKRSGAYPEAGE
jgi:hypothetical protein